MKKLTSHKELNRIAKGVFAIVLAGTFATSTTHAFADETTQNQQEKYQTVDLQPNATTGKTSTEHTVEGQEAPSLLPGDFFYFAKIAFEKIKLALTFDDMKEAQLLAGFASERLSEANALLVSDDQETAIKTINKAMEDMKETDKIVDSQKQTETEPSSDPENSDMKNDPKVIEVYLGH